MVDRRGSLVLCKPYKRISYLVAAGVGAEGVRRRDWEEERDSSMAMELTIYLGARAAAEGGGYCQVGCSAVCKLRMGNER